MADYIIVKYFEEMALKKEDDNLSRERLSKLQEELANLKDSFNDSLDTFSWSAHTTLLIDRPGVIREALSPVLGGFSPFEGKVSVLHLYEFWPARHILSVQLKTLEDDKL